MKIFPGDWQDFTANKEIRRLRKEIEKSNKRKWQMVLSLIVLLITLLFQSLYEGSRQAVIIIISIVAFAIILILILPSIIEYFKEKNHNVANISMSDKKVINVFDDEIVYDIIVAKEFSRCLEDDDCANLSNGMKAFYELEIKYYLSDIVLSLSKILPTLLRVVGDNFGQIQAQRIYNVIEILDELKGKYPLNQEANDIYDDIKNDIQNNLLNDTK